MQTPQAGWYPDPTDTTRQRYWDGSRWSDDVRPGAAPQLPAPSTTGSVPPPPPSYSAGALGQSDAILNPDFPEAIKEAFSKFVDRKGRSSRRAYWLFYLFTVLVGFLEGLFIGTSISSVVLLLPSITAGIRRLQDTDRSGWWLLLPIVNIILLCQRGTDGPNRYGAAPRRKV